MHTWHSLGSSETAFSTAKFLDAVLLDISTRQLGQVATWSRSLNRKQNKRVFHNRITLMYHHKQIQLSVSSVTLNKMWNMKTNHLWNVFNINITKKMRYYLPSANRCVKQAAHIKWPIWHCKGIEKYITNLLNKRNTHKHTQSVVLTY